MEIFSRDGDQGEVWRQARVGIPGSAYPHRIIIKGIHGDGLLGDIAVDDIKYFSTPCNGSHLKFSFLFNRVCVCACALE